MVKTLQMVSNFVCFDMLLVLMVKYLQIRICKRKYYILRHQFLRQLLSHAQLFVKTNGGRFRRMKYVHGEFAARQEKGRVGLLIIYWYFW